MKRGLLFCVIGVFIVFGCTGKDFRTTRIERGAFSAKITETGELTAVNARVLTMPSFDWSYGEPKLVELAREGTIVSKGDVVGKLETAGIVRVLGQKQAELAIAETDLQKLTVEHQAALKKLAADLEAAEAALQMAKVDTQRNIFESSTKQNISKLKYQIAQKSAQKIRNKIQHTRKIQKEEILIQKAKIRQIHSAIDKARYSIETFTLRAPAAGMIEYWRHRRTREKVKIGDSFHPGMPIIGLPDLSQMKVLTQVNETDIEKVRSGQPAVIRLDAYPKVDFTGTIMVIGVICHEKDRDSNIKVFDVEILLDEVRSMLKPGMTVSCDIIFAEFEDVFYVDYQFVRQTQNGYAVHVLRKGSIQPVPVTLGPRSSEQIVIYGDVKKGEQVVFTDSPGEEI